MTAPSESAAYPSPDAPAGEKATTRPGFRLTRPALAALVVAVAAGSFWLGNRYTIVATPGSLPSIVDNRASGALNNPLYAQVRQLLDAKYLRQNELDDDQLLYGAIAGMVQAAGDPYTAFFNPEDNATAEEQLSGTYEGIGAELEVRDGQLIIVAPISGSPAAAAGIQPNDAILTINGEDTDGLSTTAARDKIRGQAGTTVSLRLGREGETEPRDLTITRGQITQETVALRFVDNPATPQPDEDIAHLTVKVFGETTMDEWDRAVADIRARDSKGLVLDLRNNPGGYLDAGIHVGSEFFRDGTIVGRQNAEGQTQESGLDHAGRLTDIPMTVLVNKGSASASEIVAGALQARDRADVVGVTSFGKGTVQEVVDLPNGTSLHVTIAKWLLPNGQNIDKQGIKPDREVVVPADAPAGSDPQFDAAITEVTT